MKVHKYQIRKIQHPTIPNRDITLIYVNNKLDLPSLSFLVAEARSGGRKNSISGQKTHIGRAYKLIELYRELELIDRNWMTAEEEDIRKIRNRMLCWDMNNNQDYDYYAHEPIENDTMNQKLSVWMKFYKHQHNIGANTHMILNTEIVKTWLPDAFLQHTKGTHHGERFKMVERWQLQVKPSPKKFYYPALSRLEFQAFCTQLRKIDIVYEAIAILMVSTGLRIDAALNFTADPFEGWLRHINIGGKNINDSILVKYTNKGGDIKICELPIKTIHEIQGLYRANYYKKRLATHELNWYDGEEPFWLRTDGKKVLYRDVQLAFQEASIAMGKTLDRITPHHLRHTFATWLVIELSERNKISLGLMGVEPHPMIMGELMRKLGHISSASTLRYTISAYKLLTTNYKQNNRVVLTPLAIEKNKTIQKMLLENAIATYGDEFDENKYDMIPYAKKQGFAVDY